MKNKKRIAIITASTITCILVVYLITSMGKVSTNNAYVQTDIARISSRVSASVRNILKDNNVEVKTGDLIIDLDDTKIAAEYNSIESKITQQKAEISLVENHLESMKFDIEKADASVTAARADYKKYADDLSRAKNLAMKDFASQKNLGQAFSDSKKSESAVKKSVAEFEIAKKNIESLQNQLEIAKQKLAQLEQDKIIAKYNLDGTKIIAGADGYVANRAVEVGSYLSVGAPIVSIVPKNVYIVANFKETQIAKIKPGHDAKITIDSYSGKILKGKVDSISPASGAVFSILPPENASGNFTKIVQRIPVKISITENKDNLVLRPGMSSNVVVYTW